MSDQSLSNIAFLAQRFKLVLDFSGDPQVLNEIEQHARAEGILPEWWLVERIGHLHREGLLRPVSWKKPVKTAAVLACLVLFVWLGYHVIMHQCAQWAIQ